jgi:hypothetical protein
MPISRFLIITIIVVYLTTEIAAVCDTQRDEYTDFQNKCNTATDATNVCVVAAGTVGAATAILTFGISVAAAGLACAVPAGVANNMCRIKDEKLNNLRNCETQAAQEAERQAQIAAEQLRRRQAIQESVKQVNTEAFNQTQEAKNKYETDVKAVYVQLIEEGYDPENPENKELIKDKISALEKECQRKIRQIEEIRVSKVTALMQGF